MALILFYNILQTELDSMFNEEQLMEYNNGKILRLFQMKENKVPVRDLRSPTTISSQCLEKQSPPILKSI